MAYKYIVNQIRVPVDYTDIIITKKVSRFCRIPSSLIVSCKVVKRSIDARKTPQYVLSLEVITNNPIKFKHNSIIEKRTISDKFSMPKIKGIHQQPVVVGAGPAGLIAALTLSQAGLKPILIDRGEAVFDRQKTVNNYWKKGVINEESNVLYGEGGAGLFSDGKLTARSKQKETVRDFLKILIDHGASKNILIDTHPHIGSDKLLTILPSIREEIIRLGGDIRFSTKLTDIIVENGSITRIKTDKDVIKTDILILAIGHSARDTYRMLYKKGIEMRAKPFAIGVRLELSQDQINSSRYICNRENIGAAEFRLTKKPSTNARASYSFCMCPGGQVISCASTKGQITSNGMSFSKRSLPMGNAAFLVPITPEDFGDNTNDPLSGITFQEKLESYAFTAGGSDYSLPASNLEEYLKDITPISMPKYYSPHRIKLANLNEILPDFINKTLHYNIPNMLKELGNPDPKDVILYGTETRSSAPLQIIREKNGVSVNTKGLYPAGEGAGYSGGIVSSGIDGLKIAREIIMSLAKD